MAVESIDDQVSRLRAMSGCELLCNGVRYANSSLLACLSDAGADNENYYKTQVE